MASCKLEKVGEVIYSCDFGIVVEIVEKEACQFFFSGNGGSEL